MPSGSTYRRPVFSKVLDRATERRRFIQVLAGPRQVGKTTLARQVLAAVDIPAHYASADAPTLEDRAWIHAQWDLGRLRARQGGRRGGLLILDEVQKIGAWSETVKRLWDEDTVAGPGLRVMLLGSAPLLVHRGLTESLAGRFELVPIPHWSYREMRDGFGFTLEQYVSFGGYPGAATLVSDESRWRAYILDSLVEMTLARDVLLLTRVDKPALLRQLFRLGCEYSGQILSFTKMLGQLQDAGNTTTLAHYLELLGGAGMLTGLAKFSGARVRQRGSSPKLLVLNTALASAVLGGSLQDARESGAGWGRLVESSVGAHLLNAGGPASDVYYWRHRSHEVDYVVRSGQSVTAIEVASGQRKGKLAGMDAFAREFGPQRTLLIGAEGMPLEEFLLAGSESWTD